MLKDFFRLLFGTRLPVTIGKLKAPRLRSSVFIRRDVHGVPYIEAESDDDAFFAMGFCVAQDRAFHLELYTRASRGTLAEVIGAEMIDVDRLARRIGFTRIGRAQLEVMAEDSRRQLESYAAGVNAGMRIGLEKRPHEHALLRIEPCIFESCDVLGVLQFFAFALSSNWDAELARLRILEADGPGALVALEAADPSWLKQAAGRDRLRADIDAVLAGDSFATTAAKASRVVGLGGASNHWVLAPSRTATGRPMLACDPHLGPTLPSPWYLLHIRTPTWAMSGACLVSQPTITFGHNDHVAWGLTAGHVDNTDLFLEQLGADGQSVREGHSWVPCQVRDEVIRVKGKPDVIEKVVVTGRGPIVSPLLGGTSPEGKKTSPRVALSMRGTWMAARPIRYDHFRPRSVEEARQVYLSYPAVSENRVFADTSGHIAWQVAGDAPVRRKGSGLIPMPGWDPEVGWEDAPLAFDKLPHLVDPPVGFLATANNRPIVDTGVFLGADWLDGHRYTRIVEALEPRRDWTVEDTMRLQIDRKTVLWPRLRETFLAALAAHAGPETQEARRLLEGWDGIVSADSPAASVFELIFAEMMKRVIRAKAPNSFRAALGEGTNAILPHGIMALRRNERLTCLLSEQPKGWFLKGWPPEIAEAAVSALQLLQKKTRKGKGRGKGRDAWAWGRVRPLTLVHPTGGQKPFDRIFNRGPIAFGGDASTLPQSSIDYADPLGNAIGVPNFRMVIDVGHWEASRYVLAGGQSGNPLSPHYDDQLPLWERGEGIAIAWTPESVLRVARATLELVPG
jgi:penicillin amidase